MQPYIEGNNVLRPQARTNFEKVFYKLVNNAVFGKTMQNVGNHMDLHLTTNPKDAIKWFSKFKFQNHTYSNGSYLIETHREKIIDDRPVYVGHAILDFSNLKIQELHYCKL